MLECDLDEFLGLKESLKMSHLPKSSECEHSGLGERPVQHTLVSALTGLPKSLLSILKYNQTSYKLVPEINTDNCR